MNNYIIRKYKGKKKCTLAKYIIFNDNIYLIDILFNNDHINTFIKIDLTCTNSISQKLKKEYNVEFLYGYNSCLKYFSGFNKISLNSLAIKVNEYDILFEAESDEKALLRFKSNE